MTAPSATGRLARVTDDPVRIHRAAQLVRASLARQGLALSDLVPAAARTSTPSTDTRRAAA